MSYRIRLTILGLLLALTFSSYARKITKEDIGYECLDYQEKVYVAKDGSYTTEVYSKVKIINENGRDAFTSFYLHYNSYSQKLELINAQTLNDNKQYPVTASNIEDKPVASNIMGFDQINRLRIAFQQLKVGSIIEYKYKLVSHIPDIQNHYSRTGIFGNNQYVHTASINIVSEIPLYLEKNKFDNKNFRVNEKRANGLHTINITQLRPLCFGNINEQELMTPMNDYPWITLSSDKDWAKFAQFLVEGYNAIANQELPALYLQIKQKAASKSSTIEKIHEINSLLNTSIRYMGDWRTTKGRFLPRNLQEVNDTEFADCKDYSTALVAILRSLNIQADPAFVLRGTFLQEVSPNLPTLNNFNHVIVKVYDNNQVFWVDPTNSNSVVGINREDIAYRHSLVLNEQHPKLEFIPSSLPQENQIISVKEVHINGDATVNVNSTLKRQGLAAAPYTGAMLVASRANIEHGVLQSISMVPEDVISYQMELPDLNSRIVQNLTIKTTLTEKLSTIKTTSGKAYRIQTPPADIYTVSKDAIGSLSLGVPFNIQSTYIIHNMTKPLDKNLDFEIDTKWFTFTRKVTSEQNALKVEFNYINKVYVIYNDEFKTKEYKNAVDKLQREYMGGFAVILDS